MAKSRNSILIEVQTSLEVLTNLACRRFSLRIRHFRIFSSSKAQPGNLTPRTRHTWEVPGSGFIGVTRRILDSLLFEVRHGNLTHEILTTFLAEASAIVNNRPIVPVSTDPDSPFVLTPNILLTQKTGDVSESPLNLNLRDLYSSQWKVVQSLADGFWLRWRQEYLQSVQPRTKWMNEQRNLKVDDIVLLKDADQHRNFWPMGRITRVFPSEDNLVRKIELVAMIEGVKRTYVRPVTQIVPLLCVD